MPSLPKPVIVQPSDPTENEDISHIRCSKFNKLNFKLEKKLAVYKICSENYNLLK
jgi:hypothetical protein